MMSVCPNFQGYAFIRVRYEFKTPGIYKFSDELYFFILKEEGIHHKGCIPFPNFLLTYSTRFSCQERIDWPLKEAVSHFPFYKLSSTEKGDFLIVPFTPLLFNQAGRIRILQKLFP
jgi:hypothetical protein